MINSKNFKNIVVTSFLTMVMVLSVSTAFGAKTIEALSGSDLLRTVRQINGQSDKLAYENRVEKPEPIASDIRVESADIVTPVAVVESVEAVKPVVTERVLEYAQVTVGDELLRMIPSDALFAVRMNNIDYTLNVADQYLAGVSPMPMGLSMMVRMQLVSVFGNPELAGVNMSGSFVVFGLPSEQPGQDTPTIAILVPVSDYKQFVSSSPNVSEPDENGISQITSPMPLKFIMQVGDYALTVMGDVEDLLGTAKLIAEAKASNITSGLDASEAALAVEKPLWVYGNVPLVSKLFGPVIFAKMDEFKTMMAELDPNDPQSPPANIAEIIDIYASVLEKLMAETKFVSLAVEPKPDLLTVTGTISALDGTEMAELFTAEDGRQRPDLFLNYLEDGAAMNVAGRVTGKLNAKAMDFFATALSKGMSTEDVAKTRALTAELAEVFSGADAMTFAIAPESAPMFTGKYIIEVKDKDKCNKLIEEGAEWFNTSGVGQFYKELGFEITYTVERAVDSYKGVSIDFGKCSMKATDVTSPQSQMISAMYGDGIEYHWAILEGTFVCGFGANSNSIVREMIDTVKAGGPKQTPSEIKTVLELLPDAENADFIGTYNYLRLLEMVGAMGKGISFAPMPFSQMELQSSSNIIFGGNIDNGKMVTDVVLPKAHLVEIMTAFQTMQQQIMQQQIPDQNVPR